MLLADQSLVMLHACVTKVQLYRFLPPPLHLSQWSLESKSAKLLIPLTINLLLQLYFLTVTKIGCVVAS